MIRVAGQTYQVRLELRALGAQWDRAKQAWYVPDDRAAEAKSLVQIGRARRNASRVVVQRRESVIGGSL